MMVNYIATNRSGSLTENSGYILSYVTLELVGRLLFFVIVHIGAVIHISTVRIAEGGFQFHWRIRTVRGNIDVNQ